MSPSILVKETMEMLFADSDLEYNIFRCLNIGLSLFNQILVFLFIPYVPTLSQIHELGRYSYRIQASKRISSINL